MSEFDVYHVVTEKPMKLGQVILFDPHHHNGVYDRVMACKRLLEGGEPYDELSHFIHSNLEYWAVRTYRELALEKVRQEKFSNYPSRMSCLYTTRNFSDAEMWADSFKGSGRKVFQIVKLWVDGHVFDGDAYNVFEGTSNDEENERNAEAYWNNAPNKFGKDRLIETLIDGHIEVVEIVEEWS